MSPRVGYASKMEKETVDKIDFQNRDFKFVAAYNAYSSRFEKTEEPEERHRLNELISKLDSEEISYPSFYQQIDEDNEESGRRYRYHRVRIEGSRKFAYRRAQQEKNRIKRHKR
jgi:hypothetical protein